MAARKPTHEVILDFITNKYDSFTRVRMTINIQYKPNLDINAHVINLIRLFREGVTSINHDIENVMILLEKIKENGQNNNITVPLFSKSTPDGVKFTENSAHYMLYQWVKEACTILDIQMWSYKPKTPPTSPTSPTSPISPINARWSKSPSPPPLSPNNSEKLKSIISGLQKTLLEKDVEIKFLKNKVDESEAYADRLKLYVQNLRKQQNDNSLFYKKNEELFRNKN